MSRSRKQPYRDSRIIDKSCRCHGGCPWCEGNRRHATTRRALTADEQLADPLDFPRPLGATPYDPPDPAHSGT